jgi:ribonuclease BN (tRNA processing enzyme)
VKRLVLTHVLPSVDRMRHLEEAATEYDGDLALADDLQVWTLT